MKFPLATILQWWTVQSEQFRKTVLQDCPHCTEYGLTKAWDGLTLKGKLAIEKAYEASL